MSCQMVLSFHFPRNFPSLWSLLPFAFIIVSLLSAANISSMRKFYTKQERNEICGYSVLLQTRFYSLEPAAEKAVCCSQNIIIKANSS